MKVILTKGLAISWLLLAGLIIGLAILMSTARITLPMVSDYRGNIEAQVSEIMQRPVRIGSIGVGWDRLRPVMLLRDVLIRNKDDERDAFHFEQLQLSFQMFRSLRQLELIPHSIFLSGSELAVARTLDGAIVLRGLSGLRPTGSVTVGERLETFGNLALNLSDVRLVWHDQPLQQNWEFNTDELKVVFWQGGLSLQGVLQLPPELGNTVNLTAVVRGDLKDYRLWEGNFYLNTHRAQLSALPRLWPSEWPGVADGVVSTETWGAWKGLDQLELLGRVDVENFRLEPGTAMDASRPVLDVSRWAGRYHWQNAGVGWHLDMDEMTLETASRRWPVEGLSLDFNRHGDAPGRLAGDLDFIDLQDLASLLEALPVFPEGWRSALDTLQPSGEMKRIRFSIDTHTRQPRFRLDTELSQLAWRSHDRIPGISGLDMNVSASDLGGELELKGPGFTFDYPRWFEQVFDLDEVSGELRWFREGKGWGVELDKLVLENPDVRATGTTRLSFSPDLPKPLMSLEVLVPELNLARVAHYLPYGIIPDGSEKWLRKAFVSGSGRNGRVRYEGELKKDALRHTDVLFTADLDVEQGHLHYLDRWPEITALEGRVGFRNAGFTAQIEAGQISGARVLDGTVAIDDFFLSRLKLDARASGQVPQYLQFLQNSSLTKGGLKDFLSGVEGQGLAGLRLQLDVPLSQKISAPLSVDGRVKLERASLALPAHDVRFNLIEGEVAFTADRFTADGLKAEFREAPVVANIHTRENHDVVVDVKGLYSVQQLLPNLQASWMAFAPGESEWQGRVVIPRNPAQTLGPRLDVSSDLTGIAIRLPGELGKTVDQPREFLLSWELGTVLPTVDIAYNEQVKIRALVNLENGGFVIDRADVVTGGSPAHLEGKGVGIRGQMADLDLQQWAAVMDGLNRGPEGEGMDLRQMELEVDRLAAFGQTFTDVLLSAYNEAGDWMVQLQAADIAGTVRWPKNWQSGNPIEADLDRLVITRTVAGESAASGDAALGVEPKQMPSLRARIRQLRWGQAQFDRAEINAVRSADDWLIQKAEFGSDIMSLQLAGGWLGNGDRPATTRLQFKLEGRNVGSALQALEFSTGLGDGEGVIQGDVNWTGSPFEPHFNSLNGEGHVDLRDGTLKQVEPGLGRLLALINLDSLPKRLSLNFSDVSREGLHYATVSGTGRFENGVLYVDGLVLDSPGAAISLFGRTFLTSHSYDLNLNVVPKITSALPLAAGLFIAPQTGFVVYFLDKLAESLGIDFNETALLEYRITGDWDSPNVQRSTATVEEVRENPLFGE